jgi:cyanophycinase
VHIRRRTSPAALLIAFAITACAGATSGRGTPTPSSGSPVVGPPRGTVLVVGGGGQGPELYDAFITAAGGPEALIVDIPTAGGDTVYPANWRGANGLKTAGAKNVVVLHSNPNQKALANSDSFTTILKRAGGVWFEGGRQFHLVDSYGGTKTETEIMNVLARGGVVGGSSAGASILGSFMVRGAPSSNNFIMEYPGYTRGFGYLRNTGIDQHVVARERTADIADSLVGRHPDMLFISEDEGTAWLVKGDEAEILGRNKAFVYNGRDPKDPGKPYTMLLPGDRYHLGARRVISRAIDATPLTNAFIDSLFAPLAASGAKATVHIAMEGRVFAARGYGIEVHKKFVPETGVPNFAAGGIGNALLSSAALAVVRDGKLSLDDALGAGGATTVRQVLTGDNAAPDGSKQVARLIVERSGGKLADLMQRRIFTTVGAQRLKVEEDGALMANVDDLYRLELGFTANPALTTSAKDSMFAKGGGKAGANGLGWKFDAYRGLARQSAAVTPDGKRGIWVRIPGHRASVIILTDRADFDAKAAADRIVDRLLFTNRDRSLTRKMPIASTSGCRSLSAANAQVAWAGCTGGKVFRTTDGGATWRVDSVPGAAALDFRGIKAFDANTAVVVSAGPAERGQARIYRTTDGAKSWTLAWNDSTKGIFLDGVAFWDASHGFTFSDPIDGKFVVLTTDDGGKSWQRVPAANLPVNQKGEAAFAASNTQLTVHGTSNAWIATGGGPEARVFRTTDRGRTWQVSSTGMPGGASSGLFGIAFADARNGIAIGGDYRNERGATAFAVRTTDGGVTWTRTGMNRPDGTTSGVAYVPGSTPAMFVAVGQTGVAYTKDFGASWIHADTITTYGVGVANAGAAFFAGARGHVSVLAQPLK